MNLFRLTTRENKMRKIYTAFASLALMSCSVGQALDSVSAAPAPLAATVIDEKGLVIALQTFDTLLTAIDTLIAARVIVPGSPRAIAIANAIHSAKLAYQAASAAQRVGNSGSYEVALTQGSVALAKVKELLKGN
jgi:hypothetical protein